MTNKRYNEILFLDPGRLLVIQANGKIKELYVPIRVTVLKAPNNNIPSFTVVYIEEIRSHPEYKLIFRIFTVWYPFWVFDIK